MVAVEQAAGHTRERVAAAAASVRARCSGVPYAGIVLGTGLAGLAGEIAVEEAIPYEAIPGFPRATVESLRGVLEQFS